MKRTFVFASLIVLFVASNTCHASLIAGWNFNSGDTGTANSKWQPGPIAANYGAGSIDMTGWGGQTENFAGSTINLIGADTAGASLSLVAGGVNPGPFPGNGSFITTSFSTLGLNSIIVTFATRGTSTGFNSGTWSYSTDGANFTAAAGNTATTSTTYALATEDLSSISAINDQPAVFLRYTLSGATSSSGNNRIDNLQINGVPEPATIGLVLVSALATLVSRRRFMR